MQVLRFEIFKYRLSYLQFMYASSEWLAKRQTLPCKVTSDNMANKTSLSDIPSGSEVNDFGTERYVDGLVRFIERSAAPITIALQGEWGSGKTSLMNKLHDKLCGEGKEFLGINVNTWEHSMMASPEVTVYKIMGQLVQSITQTDVTAKKKANTILRGLYRGGREALKMIPGVNVMVEMANLPTDLSDEKENKETDSSASLSELKSTLEGAIKSIVGQSGKKGIIVFVDDLDRLNPPVAVEILELLKNVFTLENCIFVLAIDYDVVVKGLKPKFGELTEKNEREFRSFFDKIIQVPFSLPVNNYHPMNFVLKSLVEIGYLSDFDASNSNVKKDFSDVVEASVGKNPRSIKRLINTLSLLDCIAKCGEDKKTVPALMDDKLLNFIIVAIQICYPKIYRMLALRPDFTAWDLSFAAKMGIEIPIQEGDNHEEPHWEEILEAACSPDAYLSKHFEDIRGLFNHVKNVLVKDGDAQKFNMGKKLGEILDKSSVTGLNAEIKPEELDKKNLMSRIYRKLADNLKAKHPELGHFQLKRNTGNGGIYIWFDDDNCIDVTFTPSVNKKGQIALRLWMHFIWPRPERLKGLSFDELMRDDFIREQITSLDNVVSPLLKSKWFFKGETYEGQNDYYKSLIDELRFLHEKDWIDGHIVSNPKYWIDLDKPAHFETPEVIDTITDLLVANVNYRKAIHNFK